MPRGSRWVAIGVGGLLAAGAVLWTLKPRLVAGAVAPDARTIAVVPLHTSSSDGDVLGEGTMDLLSTNLDGIGDIRVVEPRAVLQAWGDRGVGSGPDLRDALEIGREPGAGSVLTGSLVRPATTSGSTGGSTRWTGRSWPVHAPRELPRGPSC